MRNYLAGPWKFAVSFAVVLGDFVVLGEGGRLAFNNRSQRRLRGLLA